MFSDVRRVLMADDGTLLAELSERSLGDQEANGGGGSTAWRIGVTQHGRYMAGTNTGWQ